MDVPYIYHTLFDEELKCPECNYGGSVFYSVTCRVNKLEDDRPNGLCPTCFMEMLINQQENTQ